MQYLPTTLLLASLMVAMPIIANDIVPAPKQVRNVLIKMPLCTQLAKVY